MNCQGCKDIPRMGNEPWNGWKCKECGLFFTCEELQIYNRMRRP